MGRARLVRVQAIALVAGVAALLSAATPALALTADDAASSTPESRIETAAQPQNNPPQAMICAKSEALCARLYGEGLSTSAVLKTAAVAASPNTTGDAKEVNLDENGNPLPGGTFLVGASGDAALMFHSTSGVLPMAGKDEPGNLLLYDAGTHRVESLGSITTQNYWAAPWFASASDDGGVVAYETLSYTPSFLFSLYVYDRSTGTTTLVDTSLYDMHPRVSADGRYVAYDVFNLNPENFHPELGGYPFRVRVLDRSTGTIETLLETYDGGYRGLGMSSNGRYLVTDYAPYGSQPEIVRYDRAQHKEQMLASSPYAYSTQFSISDDGQHVSFPGAYGASVYELDVSTGAVARIANDVDGTVPNYGGISSDGRFIVYPVWDKEAERERFEIYDRRSASTTEVTPAEQTSVFDGPFISRDDTRLYYDTCDSTCSSINVYSIPNPAMAKTSSGESNVLFIPGLEGSRLYINNPTGNEVQVWEPAWNSNQHDVQKLYLNSDGTSINAIYSKSGEVVDETGANIFGFGIDRTDIYKSFLDQLAQLKASSTIADYLAFPYDWRMSPEDVVNKGTLYDDGTHYLDQELISLASTSKSGKVTIVAHSNGGLVAKALMERLQQEGKTGLVDKIIFVDVPQFGTPQAIVGMLHGDNESIGLSYLPGVIVSQATARGLGENMPDAYDLLPSPAYFGKIFNPVIDLTHAPTLEAGSSVPALINNANDLAAFLTSGRQKPAFSDIETPDLLSASLLSNATALHNDLDTWEPPPGVKVIQIAGWGLDTVAGAAYQESRTTHCTFVLFGCFSATTTSHAPVLTKDGDGTVVTPSQAATSSWPTYYINLANEVGYNHATITADSAFETLFANLLASDTPDLPPDVTTTQPPPAASGNSLRLRVLSPVTLDVYDSQGRHTGIAPNPIAGSDLDFVEEQIPESYYARFGEGQYIGLPQEGTYSVVMHGTDNGAFTFEETPVHGGVEQQPISYKNIPVTASSTITASVVADHPASTTLEIDMNGDGQIDLRIASSTQALDPVEYTKLIISSIKAMDIGSALQRQLIAKFTNVEYMLSRSDKWDTADDDQDQFSMQSLLHGKKLFGATLGHLQKLQMQLVLKKLDMIEAYLTRQIKKQSDRGERQKGRGHGGIKDNNLQQISADQATAIVDMAENLKLLTTKAT